MGQQPGAILDGENRGSPLIGACSGPAHAPGTSGEPDHVAALAHVDGWQRLDAVAGASPGRPAYLRSARSRARAAQRVAVQRERFTPGSATTALLTTNSSLPGEDCDSLHTVHTARELPNLRHAAGV